MVYEKDKFDAQIQILDIRGISLTLDLSVKAVVRLSLQILMSTLDNKYIVSCHAFHDHAFVIDAFLFHTQPLIYMCMLIQRRLIPFSLVETVGTLTTEALGLVTQL